MRYNIGRTILNGRQPMSFFSNITSVFHSTENTETPSPPRSHLARTPLRAHLRHARRSEEINDEVISQACSARVTASCPSATSCTPCSGTLTW
ncbi:MAG: hypothetical protein ACLTKG_00910 [Collinsella intestinalis]